MAETRSSIRFAFPFVAALLAASCAAPLPPASIGAGAVPAIPPGHASSASADDFRAAIDADPSRAAGLFHHYEFIDIHDTPPPEGYEPFYIAHYGRHGSRYQIAKKSFRVAETLQAAKDAGVLTPAGEEILERLRPIIAEHEGMYGQLSRLGAEEHARLARRMFARFPQVFARAGKVRCQSSTIQRCLASMANFTCALKGEAPHLDFDFATGDRYMSVILHPYLPSGTRQQWLEQFDRDIVVANVDPSRLVALCFADDPKSPEIVGEPHGFAFNLFMAANSFQSLDRELGGTSLDDVFTPDELAGLARARSCIHFAHMGNPAEYGHCASWSAHELALDIARRADEAIASADIRADLRFGHDSGLGPLVGLLGIQGAGDCVPAAESWMKCPSWRGMPMASNLQIVFYRKAGARTLVKLLYNAREAVVAGLSPVSPGPYYRWDDLRVRLVTPGGDRTGRGELVVWFDDRDHADWPEVETLFGKYGAQLVTAVDAVDAAEPFFGDLEDILAKIRHCAESDGTLVLPARAIRSAAGEGDGKTGWLERMLREARCLGVSIRGTSSAN